MAKAGIRELIERTAEWPEEAREELAQSIEDIEARYHGTYVTTKEDRAALEISEDDIKHERFASDDDVRKVFTRFHRA